MKARRLELKDLGNGWSYKDMIQFIAGSPEIAENGAQVILNYAEIVKRGNLADEAEKADGVLLMDEPRYELLMRLARGFHWPRFTQNGSLPKKALDNIRTFMTELENAELTEVEAAVSK